MIFRIIITILVVATTACAKDKPLEYQDWPLDTVLDAGDSWKHGGPDGVLDVTGPTSIEWVYDESTGILKGGGFTLDPLFVTAWTLSDQEADAYYLLWPRVQYLVDEEGVDLRMAVSVFESEVARVKAQAREAYAARYAEDPPFDNEWDWLSDRKPFIESLCATALEDSLVHSAVVREDVWQSGSYIELRFKGAPGLVFSFELYSSAKRDELENAPVPEHSLVFEPEVARNFVLTTDTFFRRHDAKIDLVDGNSYELK